MINHYNEFDDFMSYFNDARKYALENAELFENIKSKLSNKVIWILDEKKRKTTELL